MIQAALLLFCFLSAAGADLFLDNRFYEKWDATLDMTENSRRDTLDRWAERYDFDWELSYDDLAAEPSEDGIHFVNTATLHDIDVFYGREGFPEGRRDVFFEGNNYNRTFNNTLLQSDDYIYRKGSFRDSLKVYVNKDLGGLSMKASFSLSTGESLEAEGTGASFDKAEFVFDKGTYLAVGKISPFFGIYTFDKRNTAIPGIDIRTRIGGADVEFVAGRPDMPLDFLTSGDTGTVNINASQWTREKDVIYHFPEPYNYFEVTDIPVWVYAYRGTGGATEMEDITAQCEVTHSDVIIPYAVLTPDTERITIVYDEEGDKAQQQMYINAFNIQKTFLGGFNAGVSYVDLHNDTHSVENTPGLTGPFDSNIWSFNAGFGTGCLTVAWQYAISKAVPDDYLYEDRERDFIQLAEADYSGEYLSGKISYFRLGADYLPNILSLRDKWKLYEDSDGDFLWNHEEEGHPMGTEGVSASLSAEFITEHTVEFVRYKDLESDYKRNPEYASYDIFYVPYYASSGNEYRYYGEGIDDGRVFTAISLTEKYRGFTGRISRTGDKDDDLVIVPEPKDSVVTAYFAGYENGFVKASVEHIDRSKPVWYSPRTGSFVFGGDDVTTKYSFDGRYSAKLYKGLWGKLHLTALVTRDADSLYEQRENMMFRDLITDFDFVDSDTAEYGGSLELIYRFADGSDLSFDYVRKEFRGEDSVAGVSMDYFRYKRGVRYFTGLGVEGLKLIAFYDEYELRFEEIDLYDYSYKRVGLSLSFAF